MTAQPEGHTHNGDGSTVRARPAPPQHGRAVSLCTRQLAVEGVGTGLLVATVVGSGIFASQLSPDDTGLQLLENTVATVAVLVALILAFGPVSGAHFNPVVTLADVLLGGMARARSLAYVAVQIAGAVAGAVLANVMFELEPLQIATTERTGYGQWIAEVVATFGLVTVILGVVRSGRALLAPFAVGGWIGAAYWFTSSTSFANPAVTVGRMFSDTFAGIAPVDAGPFVACQVLGGLLAVTFARLVFPDAAETAGDMIVPHEPASPSTDRGEPDGPAAGAAAHHPLDRPDLLDPPTSLDPHQEHR